MPPRSHRFTPRQLVDITRTFAADVANGNHPEIEYDAARRWHRRIYRDRSIDVWLISWLPTQGTQLHDHGGSSGAFTVVAGQLTETTTDSSGRFRETVRRAGTSTGFGEKYVHDVRNTSTDGAVSVHVYSAPLTSMNYYDLVDGELRVVGSLETDDPESELDPAAARRAS